MQASSLRPAESQSFMNTVFWHCRMHAAVMCWVPGSGNACQCPGGDLASGQLWSQSRCFSLALFPCGYYVNESIFNKVFLEAWAVCQELWFCLICDYPATPGSPSGAPLCQGRGSAEGLKVWSLSALLVPYSGDAACFCPCQTRGSLLFEDSVTARVLLAFRS